jgi:hypothetical protein
MFFAFDKRFRIIARQNKFRRQNILCDPRYSLYIRRSPHQARDVEFVARPEAGFFVARSYDLGGALFLGFGKCPRSIS